MTNKMKNLMTRTLSGLVLLLCFLGAILWSKWSFGALLLVVMIGALVEFYRLCRSCGYQPLRTICVITGVAIFALALFVFVQYGNVVSYAMGKLVLGLVLYLLMIIPAMFVCELWHRSETPIANVSTTIGGVVYVALPLSLMLFVPLMLGGGEWNPMMALAYIAILWVNDVFAYLVGITLGRRRMCERISPKKSWEGFFGGVVASIGAGVLCGWLLDGNMLVWGGLAAVVAVTGVAGDFVESLFKRSADVKDSGAIMPGHGGFLDRFDAFLVSAPYAFVYLLIFGNF
jgi:phosphatidate cytidylyltransferase